MNQGNEPIDPAALIAELQAQATVHETPLGDGAMIWRRWGKGPPLVLLHGGDGGWTHWIHTIPAFMQLHSVWAADLPGFGDSATPPEPCDDVSYTALIAGGLKQLFASQHPVDLIGFSFGGEVAGPVAALAPDHVRKLVIIGSNSLDVPLGDLSGLTSWRAINDPDAKMEAHRRNLEILMLADPANIDDLALHIHSSNARRARIGIRRMSETNMLLRSLSKVKAPVIGIWGERDNAAIPHLGARERALKSQCPNSEFHVIEGAGHWIMYESPEAFNTKLREVINR